MSDTPRTDAATGDCICNATEERDVISRSEALKLERELNAANDEIRRLREALQRMAADALSDVEVSPSGESYCACCEASSEPGEILEHETHCLVSAVLRHANVLHPPLVTANLLMSEGEQAICRASNELHSKH